MQTVADIKAILSDDAWSVLIEFIDIPDTSVSGNFYEYSIEITGDGHEVITDMPMVLLAAEDIKTVLSRSLTEGDRLRIQGTDYKVHGEPMHDGLGLIVAKLYREIN